MIVDFLLLSLAGLFFAYSVCRSLKRESREIQAWRACHKALKVERDYWRDECFKSRAQVIRARNGARPS